MPALASIIRSVVKAAEPDPPFGTRLKWELKKIDGDGGVRRVFVELLGFGKCNLTLLMSADAQTHSNVRVRGHWRGS
ncbi:hypothetical protein CRG98_001911 [Punica granatum]|uniref:Uncharacterized protein n=1 Tax=Punica granatum TaxID=22663 RepID=A0A2I0LAH5_PUNGR|nr:hypothetical protein CRG98_001911 [Punica granatum]